MANRRPQTGGGRRMEFGRNDRGKNFRSGVSPWQGGGPGNDLPNLLPLGGGPTEATLALASNIINLLQPRQSPVPSLLDIPIRREFGPNMGRYDRGFVPNRMGNQGNFRRTGNYNRAGERINTNRKPFRPNDGQKQQNKSSQKKEADSKAKPVKESEEDKEKDQGNTDKTETKDGEKKEAPKTRYDDVNPQLLKCHICNKSMWDGRSFENHLNGRAHAIMMQKTAESYALTADTMRQEFKIREMKRTRKTGQQPPRDFYCAMCDMYAGDGAIHRTTVGHRKLKKYLHPTCAVCHKEMPTRIELDEHRLTAEHLKVIQEKQEVVIRPRPEVMVISTLNMEQMYLRDDRQRRRPDARDRHKDAGQDKDGELKEGGIKQEVEEETNKEQEGDAEPKPEQEVKKGPATDTENTILDYKEGDEIIEKHPEMIPAYSTERGVGASFLAEFKCVQCTLCRKLLDNEETAEVHLRTWRHHQLFVRLLHEKCPAQLQQPDAEGAEGAEGAEDAAAAGSKRPVDSDESGNWKRRKTERDERDDERDERDDERDERGDGRDERGDGRDERGDGRDDAAGETKDGTGFANGNEVDSALPPADELEDWEQSTDDASVAAEAVPEQIAIKEEKMEQQLLQESPEPSPAKVNTAKTPVRGRGRGRARRN